MREAESVWKTSRVSENVRSVSQANEWTNLYEWTRLLATAVLFPTVQRCTAKCKDAPLHRAKMHCQVQVQCLVRGGIPACQQTHLPTDWQTAHIPATLIHKICPSFTKVVSHSQNLPLIHKSCLSFAKSHPHSLKLPLIHKNYLPFTKRGLKTNSAHRQKNDCSHRALAMRSSIQDLEFRTWKSGLGYQDFFRTNSGSGPSPEFRTSLHVLNCFNWHSFQIKLLVTSGNTCPAKCTYRSLIHKHWRFTPRQSTIFRQEVMCVYLANWVLQLDKWTRYWLHLHRIQYKFI